MIFLDLDTNKNKSFKDDDNIDKFSNEYIIETTSTGKRYLCPYCNYRDFREKLIDHIDKYHEESLPEGFTSTRIVFNLINKREYGSCMICKGKTEWDENKGRYDSFCSEKCKQKYIDIRNQRMMSKYGTTNLLTDEKHQEKMLANRSISGRYTFTTGGVRTYVGSYEKNFLEFIDTFLHIKAKEIISPGPAINYTWKNSETGELEEHTWITDYYFVPFNLVFDIKDGGSNPNNRDMKSYRSKQVAKEKAIADLGTYNYIRLTDNNFQQLILLFMELKDRVAEQGIDYKPIIRINEFCNPVLGINDEMITNNNLKNIVYFIPAIKDGTFTMGITKDLSMMNNIFPNNECKLESYGIEYLFNSRFKTYMYCNENVDAKYDTLIKHGGIYSPKALFEYFTEKDFLDIEQLKYDSELKECTNFVEKLKMLESTVIATIKSNTSIPMLESTSNDSIIEYAQDINGYYCYNKLNNLRSKSYNDIGDIPEKVKEYISVGIL